MKALCERAAQPSGKEIELLKSAASCMAVIGKGRAGAGVGLEITIATAL